MHKSMLHHARHLLVTWLIGSTLAACATATPPPAPRSPALPQPTAFPLPPAVVLDVTPATLPTLVVTEREASIAGNLPLLAALWASDGRIVDGRGSVTTADDYVWAGRAAILDRYTLAVFPAPPPPLALDQLHDATLTVEGDHATLVNGGDRWQFVRQDGRWWLQELVYRAP